MFAVILPGRPCLTDIVNISPNQFAFCFPSTPRFSHIVVFILPGNALPPGTAAGVYLQLPGDPEFKFRGFIANEKPSAIFEIKPFGAAATADGSGDIDTMTDASGGGLGNQAPVTSNPGAANLGISVEPIANIQAQLEGLRQSKRAPATAPVPTKILAQRIIKNAFNFLSSFAGNAGGTEVVPLKSFQDWWAKFQRRIENDPSFLEKEDDL